MGNSESTTLPKARQQTPDEELLRRQNHWQSPHNMQSTGIEKNNEDRECRTSRIEQHDGVVNHGSCAQMSKTIELLWVTVAEQSRWMELEDHSHLTVATTAC